ncbi:hypothetical protein ACFFF5_09030 [Lederbergia wuyishanensis]|uniref:Uncharacterized protein n=1 Tax=Lederbergia wuyishanensis TaxID=1347903 RepID=A0ABU0D5Z4_9BACI|nr:hypothetical protein [Lederbergia wuyishanensis]MCJ8008746.1 hypothetical protein [Lederbergia wuyishanensis]MDQ0343832.1 hypothetical protein [Lederbergia wuyishanensis]
MKWRPDILLHFILAYVMMSGFMIWLPIIRGLFDGTAYTWSGWLGIGGNGILGDYWLLLIFASILLSVIYLGWRGAQKPFHWLLLIWLFLLVVESAAIFFSNETIYFKGDTLGTQFDAGKIIFPIDLFFLSMSCFWIYRDLKKKRHKGQLSWTKNNRMMLIIFFLIFPLQLITLRFLDYDQLGVFLTLFQWLILNIAFYPWRSFYKIKSPEQRPGHN